MQISVANENKPVVTIGNQQQPDGLYFSPIEESNYEDLISKAYQVHERSNTADKRTMLSAVIFQII